MRVKVENDVLEVKRTHIYNSVNDVSSEFSNMIKDVFGCREEALNDLSALVMKSVDDDFVEVIVINKSKSDLLRVMNALLQLGYYDLTSYDAKLITQDVWKKYFL